MSINNGEALILPNLDAFLAFTYRESETELFVTTCLSLNEINELKVRLPSRAFNLHYGESFSEPTIRNWNPLAAMLDYEKQWQQKQPLMPIEILDFDKDWSKQCRKVKFIVDKRMGHSADSKLVFLDDIPGPYSIDMKAGETNQKFNESEFIAEILASTS